MLLRSGIGVLSIASHAKVTHRVGVRRIIVSAVDHTGLKFFNALHTLVDSHVRENLWLVNVGIEHRVLLLGQSPSVSFTEPEVG